MGEINTGSKREFTEHGRKIAVDIYVRNIII
jgi:predicted HTH domain antitoxin